MGSALNDAVSDNLALIKLDGRRADLDQAPVHHLQLLSVTHLHYLRRSNIRQKSQHIHTLVLIPTVLGS